MERSTAVNIVIQVLLTPTLMEPNPNLLDKEPQFDVLFLFVIIYYLIGNITGNLSPNYEGIMDWTWTSSEHQI